VSLADMFRVAPDFRIRRTTSRSIKDFLALFDLTAASRAVSPDLLDAKQPMTILRGEWLGGDQHSLFIFDWAYRKRMQLQVNWESGTQSRAGIEFPAGGLRMVRVWEERKGALQEQWVDVPVKVRD
jgi:hypothetical protein